VGFRKLFDCGTKKGSDPQYSVMALKDIKALPVQQQAIAARKLMAVDWSAPINCVDIPASALSVT